MKQKYTYNNVSLYIKENAYELVSKKYINLNEKLILKCPKGHICNISFSNFKYNNTRCKKCSYEERGFKKRLNTEDVKEFIIKNNYKIHSDLYQGNDIKITIECPNNHIYDVKFSTFKNGRRCLICSGSKKYEYEDVKNIFNDESYELLSNEYINTHTYLIIKCKNDHVYKTKLNNFLRGRRCRRCSNDIKTEKNLINRDLFTTRFTRTQFLLKYTKKYTLEDDINFKNYLSDRSKYEIDHIFPRIAFVNYNIDNYPDLALELCNHKSNLRIILKDENRSKRGKYNKEEFFEFLKNFK